MKSLLEAADLRDTLAAHHRPDRPARIRVTKRPMNSGSAEAAIDTATHRGSASYRSVQKLVEAGVKEYHAANVIRKRSIGAFPVLDGSPPAHVAVVTDELVEAIRTAGRDGYAVTVADGEPRLFPEVKPPDVAISDEAEEAPIALVELPEYSAAMGDGQDDDIDRLFERPTLPPADHEPRHVIEVIADDIDALRNGEGDPADRVALWALEVKRLAPIARRSMQGLNEAVEQLQAAQRDVNRETAEALSGLGFDSPQQLGQAVAADEEEG